MCKRILIVDDDEQTTFLLSREIKKSFNIDYDTAKDAYEALRMIDTFQYCLVITDISLPGKSGHEVVKDCIERKIPVIVISAYNPNFTFMDERVNSYLTKPIDFDQLRESIKGVVKIQDLKQIEYA